MEYIKTDFSDLTEEEINFLIEQYNQLTLEQRIEGLVVLGYFEEDEP